MVMYRGLADDLALMDWLQKYIFPAEAKTVSPEMVRVGTRLAALEMIQSGTTTFADMYYFEEEIAPGDEGGRPARRPRPDDHRLPGARREDAGRGLARAEAFIKEFAGDDLITPAPAPHSLYTRGRGRRSGGARPRRRATSVPILIHLAETEDEVAIVAGAAQADAGRVARVDRLLGPGVVGGPRRLADRRGHRDPEARAASASRTTPRAT